MTVNEEHVEALVRNYRTAWPNASDQQAWDWAATQYLDSYEGMNVRSPRVSQATLDNSYDMVYNVAERY